jgi:DNA modification methylase
MSAPREGKVAANDEQTSGVERSEEVSPRNKLNDLTAREWLPETVSVWRQKGLGAKHPDAQIERQHPAPFSFTDISRLVRFFTKADQLVLDPFVGIGSTLKAAALEGRRGVGIELSPFFADLARQRLETELMGGLFPGPEQAVLEGDAREVLPTIETDSVDFVVTSPPYWNILHKKDHKARQEREEKGLATRYSADDARDLGNIESYETFRKELTGIFIECSRVLRRNQHLCVIVGDFREGGRYHMFHADLAADLEEATPFVVKGLTILYQAHKRIFPYGYPAAFVPNLHHQYIVILRNEK